MSESPQNDAYQLRQCEVLLQLGRAAEALARLGMQAARTPHDYRVHALMAQALLGVGQPKRALEAANRAASLAPNEEWPHRLASLAYYRLRKHKLALAAAREALRLAPHEWLCFAQLARVATPRRTTRAEAERAASMALRLAPHEPEAYRVAAMVAAAAGRQSEARSLLHHAMRIDPQDASTLNEFGRVAVAGKGPKGGARLANAANGFAQAVRTDPGEMTSRHNLDLIIRSFLSKLSYLLFLDTYVLLHALNRESATWARILPVLLLAIPAFIAVRFFSRATPSVRRHVIEECSRRPLRFAVALGVTGVLAVVASAVAPASIRGGFVTAAAAAAVVCRLMTAFHLDRSVQIAQTGQAQPVFSTSLLWLIAVALVLAALLLLMAAASFAGDRLPVGLSAAVAAIAALLVFRALRQRRRSRAR